MSRMRFDFEAYTFTCDTCGATVIMPYYHPQAGECAICDHHCPTPTILSLHVSIAGEGEPGTQRDALDVTMSNTGVVTVDVRCANYSDAASFVLDPMQVEWLHQLFRDAADKVRTQ